MSTGKLNINTEHGSAEFIYLYEDDKRLFTLKVGMRQDEAQITAALFEGYLGKKVKDVATTTVDISRSRIKIRLAKGQTENSMKRHVTKALKELPSVQSKGGYTVITGLVGPLDEQIIDDLIEHHRWASSTMDSGGRYLTVNSGRVAVEVDEKTTANAIANGILSAIDRVNSAVSA